MVPALVLMALVPLMPESPRWLIANARKQEALEILAQVHANGDQDSPLVLAEYHEIVQNIEESSGEGTGYLDLFKHGNAWRTHIAMFTQIWSQLTGMSLSRLSSLCARHRKPASKQARPKENKDDRLTGQSTQLRYECHDVLPLVCL